MSTSCRRKFRNGTVANQELARCYANRGTERKKRMAINVCFVWFAYLCYLDERYHQNNHRYQIDTNFECLRSRFYRQGNFCIAQQWGMWVGFRQTVELWPGGFHVFLLNQCLSIPHESSFPVFGWLKSNSHVAMFFVFRGSRAGRFWWWNRHRHLQGIMVDGGSGIKLSFEFDFLKEWLGSIFDGGLRNDKDELCLFNKWLSWLARLLQTWTSKWFKYLPQAIENTAEWSTHSVGRKPFGCGISWLKLNMCQFKDPVKFASFW